MGAASAERTSRTWSRFAAMPAQVVMKQIAGLLARRIVFTKKVGDTVERGERVGLIKFGSRTDVIFPAGAEMKVRVGDQCEGRLDGAGCDRAAASHAPRMRDVAEVR
jgi:phosphatidylserine decarboxylase